MDLENRTIRFENPDQWQVAVTMDEIRPDKVEVHKASKVLEHYRIIDEPEGQ